MMYSIPGQEGQGKAGQIDGQVDSQSVWHAQVSATADILQNPSNMEKN